MHSAQCRSLATTLYRHESEATTRFWNGCHDGHFEYQIVPSVWKDDVQIDCTQGHILIRFSTVQNLHTSKLHLNNIVKIIMHKYYVFVFCNDSEFFKFCSMPKYVRKPPKHAYFETRCAPRTFRRRHT